MQFVCILVCLDAIAPTSSPSTLVPSTWQGLLYFFHISGTTLQPDQEAKSTVIRILESSENRCSGIASSAWKLVVHLEGPYYLVNLTYKCL